MTPPWFCSPRAYATHVTVDSPRLTFYAAVSGTRHNFAPEQRELLRLRTANAWAGRAGMRAELAVRRAGRSRTAYPAVPVEPLALADSDS